MKIIKITSFLLALTMLLSLTACKKKQTPLAGADVLSIALTGEQIREEFARNPNPLYAENQNEFALGTLVAPTILSYDAEKGWQSVLGRIDIEDIGGKTVATIALDEKLYSNSRKITIKDYEAMLRRISSIGYDGYYAEYYKNPIEGLVAYRYGSKNLTIADLPDFSLQAEEKIQKLSKEDYFALLVETALLGLYPQGTTPQNSCPDGRTFKEFVVEETSVSEQRKDTFFIGDDVYGRMLNALATIYSSMPKEQWSVEQLKTPIITNLEKEYADSLKQTAETTKEISGFSMTRGSDVHATVTFERIVDHDVARNLLNLPMIHIQSQSEEMNVTGAGIYRPAGVEESTEGCIVKLKSTSNRTVSIVVLEEELILPTIYMGQIYAASYNGKTPQSEIEKKYGVTFLKIGDKTIIYRANDTSEKELQVIAGLFS